MDWGDLIGKAFGILFSAGVGAFFATQKAKKDHKRSRFAERIKELEKCAEDFQTSALEHQLGRWEGSPEESRAVVEERHLQVSAVAIKVEKFLTTCGQGDLRRAIRQFHIEIYGDSGLISCIEQTVDAAAQRRIREAQSLLCNSLEDLLKSGPD